jgi:FkbM family methyltransferase
MLNTAKKIAFARFLSSVLLRSGLRPCRRATRKGIQYELDLREGIDLSIFLSGAFQRHVLDAVKRYVPVNGCFIDIGANIGAVTLPVAAHITSGHVYAVEPTDYAWTKLHRNISLNPELATRITTIKTFVAECSAEHSDLVAYSSWPVAGNVVENTHPVHLGVAKDAGCGQVTVDDLLEMQNIGKADFIKIDTDGHEFAVLSGATGCIARHRPVILFEAAEYLMKAPEPVFDDYAALLLPHGYRLFDSTTRKVIDASSFYQQCPRGGSMDLIAIPDNIPATQ